jgi:hypothetical protein
VFTEESQVLSVRDEWMTLPGLLSCVSREQLRERSGRLSKREGQQRKDICMLDTVS